MGLIGAVFQPLYGAFAVTLMAPAAFLQRPYRWLEAISRYRATISAGPNFAFDMCVRSITHEQKAKLDLSCWLHAACGAEPIRAKTLDRFAEYFRSCGFKRESLFPCYGLAEATLIVTGGKVEAPPLMQYFEASGLKRNVAVPCPENGPDRFSLVGCGSAMPNLEVRIVDPETRLPVDFGSVGEIWVSGPSVAAGYWNRPIETREVFGACLGDGNAGQFLRTGDLGFFHDGELFITGRRRELIIIRGQNFYPQEIENTVASCHEALQGAPGAAFSVDDGKEERLVVVQELERKSFVIESDKIFASIRQALWEEHELEPDAIVLLKKLGIPKTSSGKVQRFACRELFLSRNLPVVAAWERGGSNAIGNRSGTKAAPDAPAKRNGFPTQDTIRAWLLSRLADLLQLRPAEIDTRIPIAQYGLDSVRAVTVSVELQDWLAVRLPPTLLWDYPTIDALSDYLASAVSKQHSPDRTIGECPASTSVQTVCRDLANPPS
jgi:acyl-CoA synthetase (AMP-forming)/AMP-acid ligase II/acyl carrier protein